LNDSKNWSFGKSRDEKIVLKKYIPALTTMQKRNLQHMLHFKKGYMQEICNAVEKAIVSHSYISREMCNTGKHPSTLTAVCGLENKSVKQ
jgi:hypothetical protein